MRETRLESIDKLMVMTAAVFPSEEDARKKMWIFLESTKKAGVSDNQLHLYGIGRRFGGYKHMKLDCQLDYLLEHKDDGYTHVLYHDGWDGMFCGSLAEIVAKYEALGSPEILSSASTGLGNVPEPGKTYAGCFDESVLYKYPCVGGYMAEISAIIAAFERMRPMSTGDDCFCWYDGWKEGWFRPQLDSECRIFQLSTDYCEVDESAGGRLRNTNTGSLPCLLHLSGGYTDQVTGKDDRMIPWARRLGVIE